MSEIVLYLFIGVGLLAIGFNLYTGFVRYPLHRWRGGTRETFQWVSGWPIVGSLFLWIAAGTLIFNGDDRPVLIWSLLIISLFDTGGLHWFIVIMFWQEVIEPRRSGRK